MAQLISDIAFTGSLGNLSAYRRRDIDKIIIRHKGGASKKKIKEAKEFINTRRINAEFGGRATASKWVMNTLWQLKPLADHNIAGPLNRLIKPIQVMDTVNDWGKRNICFTKSPKLLDGFDLNRKNPFDSIVRAPLSYRLSKDELSAHIDIPALIPGIHFFVPPVYHHPLYRFIMVLGVVPDLFFKEDGYEPEVSFNGNSKDIRTDWYPVLKGSPAGSYDLQLSLPQSSLPVSSFSLMLSVGICFGTLTGTNEIQQVKYAGAAKVVTME